jgi:hypothetical protein
VYLIDGAEEWWEPEGVKEELARFFALETPTPILILVTMALSPEAPIQSAEYFLSLLGLEEKVGTFLTAGVSVGFLIEFWGRCWRVGL